MDEQWSPADEPGSDLTAQQGVQTDLSSRQ